MTDITEMTDQGIGADLSYTLPEADYSSNGVIHRVSSSLAQHGPGQNVTFNIPNLGYLNAGSWITIPIKSSEDATTLTSVESCFQQIRAIWNGVEATNAESADVLGNVLLKDKVSTIFDNVAISHGVNAVIGTDYTEFTMTFPKGSMLNANNKLPLKNFSTNIVLEMTVAPTGNAFYRDGDVPVLTIGQCELNLNLSDVDNSLDSEIMDRMIDADSNPDMMIPFVFSDYKVQSTSVPAQAGSHVLIYNDLVSSMKSLRCVFIDTARKIDVGARVSAIDFIRNDITQYQVKANGQNLIQNPVPVFSGIGNRPDAYNHYLDVAKHNQSYIDTTGSTFTYDSFYKNTYNTGGDPVAQNGVFDKESPSFQACVDVDSQNQNLLRGLKVLNSLAVEITKSANGVACTAYLIENFNRIVFFSRSKLRVIR